MNLNRIAILSAFAIGLALASCVSDDESAPENNDTTSSSSSVTGRPLSKEGEFCGGIAAFQCEPGLTCMYEGAFPDAGGTCVRE